MYLLSFPRSPCPGRRPASSSSAARLRRAVPPARPGLLRPVRLQASLLRAAARPAAGPRRLPGPHPGAPARPPLLLSPRALHRGRAGRSRARGLLSVHSDPGLLAAPRPLPGRDPRAAAALPRRRGQSERLRRSVPCPSVCRSVRLAPRPGPQIAPSGPGPSDRPRRPASFGLSRCLIPALCSPLAALAQRLGLRRLEARSLPCGHPRPRAVGQLRWPRAWPPGLGPGLPASAPAPQQQVSRCPSVQHPRLCSPAQPECHFGAHSPGRQSRLRSPGPACFVPDRASWPRHPRPPARPRCGSTCWFGRRPYCLSPVSHGIHAPTPRYAFQCPGLGLAPGLPASPPAPPGCGAASAPCQR